MLLLFLCAGVALSCTPFVPTFHIHSQYEILFHFSCHTFYKVVIGLFYQSCVSHSLLKLLVFRQHTTWFFSLSSELFSAITMFLSHLFFLALLLQTIHTFFSSTVPFFPSSICLNSFLFTVSLHSIISAAFTPSINGPTEFLTYHPNLFSSILIHHLQLSLLGYSAPCIVMNFLALLSKLFNSSVFHFRIPVPYLITEASQVLTAIILFLLFNFNLNITLNRDIYYLLNSYFISFSLILSVSNIPKYV